MLEKYSKSLRRIGVAPYPPNMPMSAKTRNEAVHDVLRDDILTGSWRPGQKLAFAELCSRYVVSVGVIREALARLVEQGLVESRPQQGFTVAAMTAEDLVNLTELRCGVEDAAIRAAIIQGDLAWESQVLAAHHRLENTPMSSPNDPQHLAHDWVLAHMRFHTVLVSGTTNVRLTAVAEQLRRSAQLYCCWLTHVPEPGTRDIAAEHRGIVEATLARDADLAARLLVDHIRRTADLMLDDRGSLRPLESNIDASGLLVGD